MKSRGVIKIFFWLLLVAVCTDASAQQFIYLKKKNTAKTKKINLYEIIRVTSTNGEQVKGTLYNIAPDALVVEDEVFNLEDIIEIKHYNGFAKGIGRSLQYGGLFFAGIFTVNSLITGARPILTPGNWYFIGGLVVAGVVLELISMKRYNVKEKWNMEIIIIPKE